MEQMQRLLEIMRKLRSEDGCPWDREQTLESLRPYAVEEVYEVIDAIDRGDVDDHQEELGDLLLQVVFQAQLREEEGAFNFEAVAKSIADKLVRRHPHVFGDVAVSGSEEVLKNWNEIKAGEKAEKGKVSTSVLDSVPVQLPALLKAGEIQKKVAKIGFDWPSVSGVLDKIEEELSELRAAMQEGDSQHVAEEFGDVLFAMANLGRHVGVCAEQALQDGCGKFQKRFREAERRAQEGHEAPRQLTLDAWDRLWDAVKRDTLHG